MEFGEDGPRPKIVTNCVEKALKYTQENVMVHIMVEKSVLEILKKQGNVFESGASVKLVLGASGLSVKVSMALDVAKEKEHEIEI